jgi:1-acyl-sn-glycerol-3-phosphate acyltransferase
MIHSICRFFCIVFCKLMFRLKAHGRQNLPKNGGFILASNHVSYLDPIIVGSSCPRKLNYMGRHDLFNNPLISRLLYAVGTFPVKRNSADLSALKEAMRRVKAGKGLLLFPEGRRKDADSSSFDKPQAGIGFLAAKLGVPVIPVFVKGSEKAFPRGAKFIRPANVHVYFGKEIKIERGLPYQDIAEEIMKNIRHLSS